MSAAQTNLFGMRIPVDPKILFGGLAAIIVLMFWYNSRSDETGPSSSGRPAAATPAAAVPLRTHTPVSRRAVVMSDRGTLRLRPIDPTKGDIDPTLRLDLLARLQNLQPSAGGRSLFEAGRTQVAALTPVPAHPPILPPRAYPGQPGTPGAPGMGGVNAIAAIPLKYYGYLKPNAAVVAPKQSNALTNRGFFLDGDNVLVASEGEILKQRYLVVELTPNSARLEDTQLRQGQTLPVVVAAMP